MSPRKKPTTKNRPAKSGKKKGGHPIKVIIAALFILGFLVGSLIFLSHLRESLRSAPRVKEAPAPAVVKPTETEPPVESKPRPSDRGVILEDIRVELESALLRSGVSLSELKTRKSAKGPVRIDVQGEFPPSGLLTDLDRRLARIDPGIRLERRRAAGELELFWDDASRFHLYFHPPIVKPPPPPPAERPRLALVMDDLGRDLAVGKALLALDLPVTLAILPGEAHAAQLAEMAHRQEREILIHIPMEPQGYPVTDPGSGALFVQMSGEEIRRRLEGFVKEVPHAVGANNHMGSRFTEDRAGMQVVMEAMKESHLFFLDSLTSGGSIGYAEARRAGVPAAVRDVFLDNTPEVEKIAAEVRRVARLAKRQGHAVGICHPYPETIEALRRETEFLQREGVEVVPVSRVLVH